MTPPPQVQVGQLRGWRKNKGLSPYIVLLREGGAVMVLTDKGTRWWNDVDPEEADPVLHPACP